MRTRKTLLVLLLWALTLGFSSIACYPQVKIVQLSDTHIGLSQAPHAAENLSKAVQMINAIHPDAVVVTGDIGENAMAWQIARSILKGLHVPLFYVPGNHDVHLHNVAQYRKVFGPDYYRFDVRGVIFIVVDSQLLGNFENVNNNPSPPLPSDTLAEGAKMLAWLSGQAASIPKGATVIAVQHIPLFRNGGFPDSRPYWVVGDPFRSRELASLQKMGVKHMLVGHWHDFMVFTSNGITFHEGTATSWNPLGGHLGFAVHTISSSGNVTSEFVALPGAKP
ncbi:MAG TPA: metallophosphoesterase [Candidatus Angelobacter sp.]|nr:metallophosphoesterase [Candidatus Angelobacter sp.]